MDGIGTHTVGPSVDLTGAAISRFSNQHGRGVSGLRGEQETPGTRGHGVIAEFSSEGLALSRESGLAGTAGQGEEELAPGELTPEEEHELVELRKRDAEVRRHEAAHVAAAGQYANGGAKFEFTVGPNGQRFATGGEVSIDVSRASTPEATIAKARVVRRAANAPAQPSAADRQVGAAASRLEAEARRELAEQRQEKLHGGGGDGGTGLAALAPDNAFTASGGDEPLAPPQESTGIQQRLDVQA